jgi:multidrug efflux system membrane fusion protein
MHENPAEKGHVPVLEPATVSKIGPVATRAKRRTRPVLVMVAGIALILGVVWWKNRGENLTTPKGGFGGMHGGRSGSAGPLPVLVRPAMKGDINIYLDGLGTVTPLANVTLRAQISGLLMQVNFQEGQMVKQGDVLAVIDPRPYAVALEQAQGQLLQAQAQLAEAQADFSRYVTLSGQDSISKQQVDAQRALVAQDEGLVKTDQAAVDNANLNLTYCHVAAPVTGRVGLRQVDPGNYVTPGDASGLVVLAQVQPISVIFTLPEDNIPQITARMRSGAEIPVLAFDRTQTNQLASGTLSTIDNEVDTTTGTVKLRAIFPNADGSLFANQFVNVRMLLDVDQGATVIPTSAVELGQQGSFVYVVGSDNTVAAQSVTLGPTEGERVAVLSGLNLGDRVVVDGADKLKDGQAVIVQRPNDQGGAGAHHKRRHQSAEGADGTQPPPAHPGSGQ